MPQLRVHNLAVSLDGFAAGPGQDLDHPLGIGGEGLHGWVFATRPFRESHDLPGGDVGMDADFIEQGDAGIGATIMGRNMFGPVRGAWPDETWTGWWGVDPPYHHPVFVLTHHARPPVTMEGGTTFTFVVDGIESALEQAFAAADGQDVRLGGGASTIQQYLRAGLVDELHVAIVPILLGSGERLFERVSEASDAYSCTELASSGSVAHVRLTRTA
ncbi:dihydrofolate reductase family protein [Cellulomonas sp. P22]|uniref:dihydrofolate reductase family protein n=1 Tax=Cellulomonas sp. P22 TaxID=3373189 RepID=UPI0037AC0CF5